MEHDYIGFSPSSLKETELRLGLPGSDNSNIGLGLSLQQPKSGAKRGFFDAIHENGSGKKNDKAEAEKSKAAAEVAKDVKEMMAPKGQVVVGWPPIRSYRKNTMATNPSKKKEDDEKSQGLGFLYVKVSMDGAPYLRKVDLKTYNNYKELSSALGKMFSCFTIGQCGSNVLNETGLMDLLNGSKYVLTYKDKDGDWMLVGDVPWDMFTDSCKRLRIMKGSDAIGLAPRAMEKNKNSKPCN